MKKRIRIIAVSIVLTMVMALPVMAQEVTDPTKVIKEETFMAGEDKLANEFHNSEVWRSENYVKYLDGVVYNLNETARIKKEVVTNYEYLSKYNPYYASLIPAAEKDFEEAVLWVDFYKVYRNEAQKDLRIRYKY